MLKTWRWFGPEDRTTLSEIRQAGAEGIVTALHDIPAGTAWPRADVARRRETIEAAGLRWAVVESIPVSENIKTRTGDWRADQAAWVASLEALAAEGVQVVCYNFMPALDWTRTALRWPRPDGATAMRFDLTDFAAFDLHILARPGAAEDFPDDIREAAARRARQMDDAAKAALSANIIAGLPGAMESWTLADLRAQIARYAGTGAEAMRARFLDFLSEVVPHAERLGMRLCAHPDDPPWPLLGLPRILSTEADYRWMLDAVDSPANGATLCSGSLGARADNDLPAMARRLGPRIHFAHLRNVRRDADAAPCSFFEERHLEGGVDMVALVAALLAEETRRGVEGRADAVIAMRPDHGQELLDDHHRGAPPGYPAIGRLKGLAELDGVMRALDWRASA